MITSLKKRIIYNIREKTVNYKKILKKYLITQTRSKKKELIFQVMCEYGFRIVNYIDLDPWKRKNENWYLKKGIKW